MVFCDSYLPGHRGGGGMWAVRNLADRLSDRYDFFIVTRDCDGKLDDTPYVKVARNRWVERPEAVVFYASPSHLKPRTFAKLVNDIRPDAIYLNSVLSKVCVRFLFARRRFLDLDLPVVLAPCGELSEAAFKIKGLKKRAFFVFAKTVGLFRNLIWKAASEDERKDVSRLVSPNAIIAIAPELTPKAILPDFSIDDKPRKQAGDVRLIYLSRVTRKKNLHFLLELLQSVESGSVALDVIGPSDDSEYLEKCRQIAANLPANIQVEFRGGVDHDDALNVAKNSHFMVLPTRNENFGYVVIESLAAGCPVLLSDQVDWNAIPDKNAGWKIPLTDREAWLEHLQNCILMPTEDYARMSFSARDFAVKYLTADESTEANRSMFDSVLVR